MARLLIFLVIVVLIQYLLVWALTPLRNHHARRMQLVDVEPVERTPPCLMALRPPRLVAPGWPRPSGGGVSS